MTAQTKFAEDILQKIEVVWSVFKNMSFQIFEICFPQILFSSFLNTLSYLII